MSSFTIASQLDDNPRTLGWERVHAEICRLARRKNAYEVDEAKWLLAAWKTRVHEPLGFGSFYEYIDRVLGYSRRFVAERLRVARALADLPRLCAAVRRGDIPWSAARELSRVATEDTVDAWIESARGETVRDIERAVAGRQPGDLPTDPPDEAVRRHRVSFEVQGETLALLRAAQEKLLVDAGGHVDDDAVVQAMARSVLDRDAGDDIGRAAYQLCLHECVRCGAAHAEGGGELVPVDAAVLEAARCDAQEIGRVDGAYGDTHGGGAGGARDPAGAADEKTHVGATGVPRRRASQTIPPAIRRKVVRRHHGRCAVPGCRHSGFVHQHHHRRRADGGGHDPDELCLLCEGHHRATHEGYLVIEGSWSAGFVFRHADGSLYGSRGSGPEPWPSPTHQSRIAAAMRALRGLGRTESDAKRLVDRVATHVGPGATAAELFQMATVASGWTETCHG